MRLKTLELQGFKSFPDKTVINFDKGITVIVGPNGSGKSNISDAMRWVLGEMSTKTIRGTKMEDVIFSGSQKRSPMGFAEVTVTFDNSGDDGARFESMAEYDEVSVSRRYYRTGDSEYYINNKTCRLRDVRELFMNTGMGKGGYSIIGQGKIAEIVSQKSEERRAVFEEAAGISKYRYQKEDAERKLAQTNANLQGAEIILNELEGRVEPLRRDSEKARKYLDIYEAKKALDISVSLYDIDQSRAKVEDVGEKLLVSKTELENLDDTKVSLENMSTETYEAFMKSKADIENNYQLTAEANEKALSVAAEIKVAEANREHYKELMDSSDSKTASDQKLFDAAFAEYEKAVKELKEGEKRKNAVLDKIAECEGESADKDKDMEGIENQIHESEDMIESLQQEEIDAKVQASMALTRKNTNADKFTELCEEINKHKESLKTCEDRISQTEEKIADFDEKGEDIKNKLDAIDEKKAALEKKQQEIAERKNALFLDISQKRHRVQNLVRMDELLDGYSSAVKFVINENSAGKIQNAGIHGPVSKIIEVEPKYSTALEIAFGPSLQNIVVDNEDNAKAIIAYLKKKNAGRVTLYPLTTMQGRDLEDRDLGVAKKKGYIALGHELVNCQKEYKDLVKYLVGRVIICDTIDNASELAAYCGYRYKVVTLDGQVVNAGGSYTGGSVSTDGGMLSRRATIDKLNAEITELEAKSKENDEAAEGALAEAESIKKEEGMILGNASVIKTLRDAETTQLEILKSSMGTITETISRLEEEKSVTDERTEKETRTIEELNKKEIECREKQDEFRQRIRNLEEEKRGFIGEIEEFKVRRADLAADLAKEEQFCEIKKENVDAAKERLDARQVVLDEDKLGAADIEEKRRENEENLSSLKNQHDTAENEKKDLESQRTGLSEESGKLQTKLDSIRTRQEENAHRRELVFEENTKLSNQYDQLLEKQDTLLGFLWDTYEMTYSTASDLGYEKITKETRSEAVAQQTKYKNIMRSLGNVNLDSIEEYVQVKERYEYYSTQIDDLHKSRDDLEKIIMSLNGNMEEDFRNTIEEVNGHFGRVFSELFGGGHAEIKLTDPKNVLESGIDINVAPPGKIIKSLSLLSGGEQAFVAIALYFAIFKVNPSPFCILDEIESALDEVNVDKFADYVKKYSERTQFLLITHRRGTMEAAERLYGVTMHEKGISDVLSIDVSEIESKIGAEIK